LRSLIEPNDKHNHQHIYAIDNAISAYRQVATVFQQSAVDKYHHQTCTNLHTERRQTYAQNRMNYVFPQPEIVCMKPQLRVFEQKM
jgi:hypothetical protein